MTHLPASKFLDRRTPPTVFTLIALASVGALAMNMFLPSLPAMADHFDTSYSVVQLTVTLFLAMNAVFQLFIGPLSDRFGRRVVTLWSLVIFCLASLGCVFAPTIELFLICRIFQAVVVAGLVLSRAAIRDMYDSAKAASMMGYVTMGMALVPMVGPALGGGLDSYFGWVASFWVLLGVGIFTLALTYWDMGETNLNPTASIAAQFRALPELLASPRFWGYCLTAAFGAGAYFAYLGGAAYVGTEVFGLSPAILGIYFGAPAVGYMVGNGLSGALSQKVGVNRMIFIGVLLTLLGLALCIALFVFTKPIAFSFFGCVIMMGLGNGLMLPNAMSGMMSVRPHLAGSASGFGGTIMTAGGALIAAGTGAVLTPGSGAMPLILIMTAVTIGALLSITYVIRRTANLES
ncbi:MAG: multidrug effflux MFS transporter [Planktomarina sp.]